MKPSMNKANITLRYYDNRLLWMTLGLCLSFVGFKALISVAFNIPFETLWEKDDIDPSIYVVHIPFGNRYGQKFYISLLFLEMFVSLIPCKLFNKNYAAVKTEEKCKNKEVHSALHTLWIVLSMSFPLTLAFCSMKLWIPHAIIVLATAYLIGHKVGFEVPYMKENNSPSSDLSENCQQIPRMFKVLRLRKNGRLPIFFSFYLLLTIITLYFLVRTLSV